jgi:hypothetical protein
MQDHHDLQSWGSELSHKRISQDLLFSGKGITINLGTMGDGGKRLRMVEGGQGRREPKILTYPSLKYKSMDVCWQK